MSTTIETVLKVLAEPKEPPEKIVLRLLHEPPEYLETAVERYSEESGLSRQELTGIDTCQSVHRYRLGLYFLLRQLGATFESVGEMVGHRHYSTIISGVNLFTERLKAYKEQHPEEDLRLKPRKAQPNQAYASAAVLVQWILQKYLQAGQSSSDHYQSADRARRQYYRKTRREAGLRVAELLGRDRRQRIIAYREGLYFLLHELGLSYPEIGSRLKRDHSTILHGAKVFETYLQQYVERKGNVESKRESKRKRPSVQIYEEEDNFPNGRYEEAMKAVRTILSDPTTPVRDVLLEYSAATEITVLELTAGGTTVYPRTESRMAELLPYQQGLTYILNQLGYSCLGIAGAFGGREEEKIGEWIGVFKEHVEKNNNTKS